MASGYGGRRHDDNLGSRLSDSSWRPSSGPYDAVTPSSQNNPLARTGSVGWTPAHPGSLRSGGIDGPTPNSLTGSGGGHQHGERHVQFSRAEYKAPNSLQNSLENGGGPGGGHGQYHGHRTPDSFGAAEVDVPPRTPGAPGYDSLPAADLGEDGRFRGGFRSSHKSYVERYRDVRDSPSECRPRSRSSGRASGRAGISVGSGGGSPSSRGRRSRSLGRERYATELERCYDDDDASERTPLERWESRKERKMKEKSMDYESPPRPPPAATMHRKPPSPPPPPQPPTVTPTQHASQRVTKNRATRWSPVEEEGEYEGYEEYDDFGPTSRHSSRGHHSSRESSHDRSSVGLHGSSGRSRSHAKSVRSDEDRRRREERRPDPHGQLQSSRISNDGIGNVGESSPLFDDVDDTNAENTPIADRSSLSVDHRFCQSELSSPTQVAYPRSSSLQRSPRGHSSTRPSAAATPRAPAPPRRAPRHRASRPPPTSTYADDLASFTESVTSSVASSVASHRNQNGDHQQQQHQPSQHESNPIVRTHEGRQYSPTESEDRDIPGPAVPPHGVSAPVLSVASSSHHTASVYGQSSMASSFNYPPPSHQGAPYGRDRQRASDFCERFTAGCNSRLNGRSADKSKRRYLFVTLIVCAACVVGAGVAIYFLGMKQEEREKGGAGPPGIAYEDEWVDGGALGGTVGGANGGINGGFDGGTDSGVNDGLAGTTTGAPDASRPLIIPPSAGPTENPTFRPSVRPTTLREQLIGEFLHALSPQSSKQGTPQHRARAWIVHEDRLRLQLPRMSSSWGADEKGGAWRTDEAERIGQRYALVTCYYAMGIGDGGLAKGWLEGGECREDAGDYGTVWDGVGCDGDGRVRALALDGANLHGTIPPELSLLTSVENLILKNNPGLSGRIPHSLGLGMTQLRQLGLYNNALTGTVPKNIFRLNHLVYLNLADNTLTGKIHWAELGHHQKRLRRLLLQNNFLEGTLDFHLLAKTSVAVLALSNNIFSGHVDNTVGNLTSLEYLYLDGNKLVGSIPDGIGYLKNLRALNLDENELYGTLPQTMGQLKSLEYLSARDNTLSGGLPSSMKLMKGLRTLNLASNALSGRLGHISYMTGIEHLHLYQNSFSGRIDGEIFASLSNLKTIFLSSNMLTGGIPPEVAAAQKKLKGLYLSDNELEGGIPREMCSLYNLEDLYLDANALEGTLPSCLGSLSLLKRFHVFKNRISGTVPAGFMNLPHLIELGLEENDIRGGMDGQATCRTPQKGLRIWADCVELDGGCECCEKCCSDKDKNC